VGSKGRSLLPSGPQHAAPPADWRRTGPVAAHSPLPHLRTLDGARSPAEVDPRGRSLLPPSPPHAAPLADWRRTGPVAVRSRLPHLRTLADGRSPAEMNTRGRLHLLPGPLRAAPPAGWGRTGPVAARSPLPHLGTLRGGRSPAGVDTRGRLVLAWRLARHRSEAVVGRSRLVVVARRLEVVRPRVLLRGGRGARALAGWGLVRGRQGAGVDPFRVGRGWPGGRWPRESPRLPARRRAPGEGRW
jgi:hypothetical protein